MALVIQKQAGLYHDISTESIMPSVIRLGVLLSYNPVSDAEKIKEEFSLFKEMDNNAQNMIEARVKEAREAFLKLATDRLNVVNDRWNKLTISNPVVETKLIAGEATKIQEKMKEYKPDDYQVELSEDHEFDLG